MSPASNYAISFTVDRRRNLSKLVKSGKTFAQSERERAQQLIAGATARKSGNTQRSVAQSTPVDNALTSYIAEVQIGSPATTYELMIDTRSSNTWVGAGRDYVPTSTSTQTSNSVMVDYGFGSFSGTEFTDQVALSPDLVIQKQSIGVASTSNGFDGLDGLLGFGPTGLTIGTLSPDTKSEISTVVDNLFTQGTIPSAVLSLFFEPATPALNAPTGEMTFGGTDPTKVTGQINFVPITTTSPASEYWGIDSSAITYGGETLLNTAVGIIDSGTTLVLLASNVLTKFLSATGAAFDDATGLLKITQDDFQNLQSLNFRIGGQDYTLTPNALLFPRYLNIDIGGDEDALYLVVGDSGSSSGHGFDFIMGYTFLERFYSVFDTSNKRVGLAETAFTNATTN